MKLILVGVLIMIYGNIISCSTKEKSNIIVNNPIEIKVDKATAINIKIDDFAHEVKYIKLETVEESQFSLPNKIIINTHGIFILDRRGMNKVFHFTLEGKFLGTIGHPGKGEGEYVSANDFLVNEKTKTIEIDCRNTRTNYIYDFENNFIKKIKHEKFVINAYTKFPNGNYLHFLDYARGMKFENYNFLVTDQNFNSYIDYFIEHEFESEIIFKWPFSNITREGVFITYGFNNSIYHYDQSAITNKYFINFGKHVLPKEMKDESQKVLMSLLLSEDYCGYISNVFQMNNYLYYNFLSKRKDYFCCLNRTNNKNLLISNIVGAENESYDRSPQAIFNKDLVFVLYLNKLLYNKEYKKGSNTHKYGKFETIMDIKEVSLRTDNPILVFMQPKDIL